MAGVSKYLLFNVVEWCLYQPIYDIFLRSPRSLFWHILSYHFTISMTWGEAGVSLEVNIAYITVLLHGRDFITRQSIYKSLYDILIQWVNYLQNG